MSFVPGNERVLVWDLSVRLFHWALVACVTALLITGFTGAMRLHLMLGNLTVGLVVFRWIWGWAGSQTARFDDFVAGPLTVTNYLRKGRPLHLGHNPIGGWMVVLVLTVLTLQALTGLIGTGDGLTEGPLARWVMAAVSSVAYEIHALLVPVIILLALLHIVAVFIHQIAFREEMIKPMINGYKRSVLAMPPPKTANPWNALMCWVFATTVVSFLFLI